MGGGYAELGARLACAAEAVVGSYALRGVASVDFLVDRDQFHVLEVNPRPGASLDAYDLVHRVSLFERHVRACQGNLGKSLSPPTRAAASAIVYTRSRLIVPYGMDWPVWSADRGEDGTVLFPGHPVCTVFADGVDAIEARRRALDRAEEMLERLERGTAAIHATWAAAREASASART